MENNKSFFDAEKEFELDDLSAEENGEEKDESSLPLADEIANQCDDSATDEDEPVSADDDSDLYAESELVFEDTPSEPENINLTVVSEDIDTHAEGSDLMDESDEIYPEFPESQDTEDDIDRNIDSKDNSGREAKTKSGTRAIDTIFDFLELFIFTFVAVLLATSFLFRHSVVSGPSMMNTLQDGDKLIISDLFYEPEYKDIIVVQDYTAGITSPIVKRVIATEGQTVRITNFGISVDGVLLEEEYIFTDGNVYSHLSRLDHTKFEECPDYEFFPGSYCQFTVPENELFVLGDHRNISQDSCFYGNVREDAVLGKVILRFYPEFELFID